MKKIITIALIMILTIGVCFINTDNVLAKTKTNRQIATQYCKTHYSEKSIKFVKEYSKLIDDRKNKPYVVVEKVVSKSKGNYGCDSKGYHIAYNKYHKKNSKVVSYVIYNPYTNYCDDVVAVVDSHMIR